MDRGRHKEHHHLTRTPRSFTYRGPPKKKWGRHPLYKDVVDLVEESPGLQSDDLRKERKIQRRNKWKGK